MIKLEHVVLASPEQIAFIIEGMRNPMNSWEKGDSSCGTATRDTNVQWNDDYFIGTNDAYLMQHLANAGTDHRKFMRMMPVYVRITAPLYWWKEFDTYKVGTVANSCSTMHKIQAKEFRLEDFSCEHLSVVSLDYLRNSIEHCSYNQTRNVMMNYEVLANIYKSRKDHKLDEWRNFCEWIEELPYSELITGGVE